MTVLDSGIPIDTPEEIMTSPFCNVLVYQIITFNVKPIEFCNCVVVMRESILLKGTR